MQEATTHAEHIISLGRRTPIERLAHFLLELQERLRIVGRSKDQSFTLPFSQNVMADVLGLSVPHLNRMMQKLRLEKLIADKDRHIKFIDKEGLESLAHYRLQDLAVIPPSNDTYVL